MDASAREQKLALARKKLKEFQQHQNSVTGGSTLGDSQTHNSSQSSLLTTAHSLAVGPTYRHNDNNHNSGRESAISLPNTCASATAFTHDEATSPFERVNRARSHSREATQRLSFTASRPAEDSTVVVCTPDSNNYATDILPPVVSSASNSVTADTSTEHATQSVKSVSDVFALQSENEALKSAMSGMQQQMEAVNKQMSDLYGHYSALHAAYNQVCSDPTSQNDAQQQQRTIAVLVEEKAELQSQLRQAMDIANEKHLQNEELQGRLKSCREQLDELENKTQTTSRSHLDLQSTLNKQAVELDKRRQESSQWEAKVIALQQDKSELQARLKVKAREVDRLQAEMGDQRKQLQMKEIYIRQLSAHAAGVSRANEQEDMIVKLENELSNLKTQLVESGANVEAWRTEAQNAKQMYEQYGTQLNEKLLHLSTQVESLTEQRDALQNEKDNLLTQVNNQASNNENQSHSHDNAANAPEIESLNERLQSAAEQQHSLHQQIAQVTDQLNSKESEISELEQSIERKDKRLSQLEEQISIRTQYSADTQKLVEQVQNERATVSRAVAQNRLLKDQLQELQDQFVKITNENMELTSKVQTLEHQASSKSDSESIVQQLQNELVVVRAELESEQTRSHNQNTQLTLQLVEAQKQVVALEQSNQAASEESALTSQHQIDALKQQNVELRARVEHLNTVLATNTKAAAHSKAAADNEASSSADQSVSYLSNRVQQLEQALNESTSASTRIATENAELHRIMQQNSEDENQNTIYVELQQALDRITSLSDECNYLRAALKDAEQNNSIDQAVEATNGHLSEEEGDAENMSEQLRTLYDENLQLKAEMQMLKDKQGVYSVRDLINGNVPLPLSSSSPIEHESGRESICSEHQDQRRDVVPKQAFDSMRDAMEQLQSRFTKAMTQNADLDDKNQQLEHLITQLQHETDTVGEYITIYQHHRRQMRQRLQQKDEMLQKLSRENQSIQDSLQSLQKLVMQLLSARGDLHTYDTSSKPVHSKKRVRSYSQTTVDEVSGDEEIVIGDEAAQTNGHNHNSSHAHKELDEDQMSEVSGTTAEILRLLSQMRQPELSQMLPVVDRSIHCNECTGKLIVV